MNKFIPAFSIFLLWSFFGYFWLNDFTFNTEKTKTSPLDTIQFPATGTLVLNNYDFKSGIKIFKNDTKITIPNSIASFKDSIYKTLNDKQDKTVVITGKYPEKIVDSLSTATQGLSRAELVKKELIDFGINPIKIKTASKCQLFKYDSTQTYANGISIAYEANNNINVLTEDIQKKHIFYYQKGKEITLDNRFKRYVYELKSYLEKNKNAKAELTIFTDSDGTKAKNYWSALDWVVSLRRNLYKNYDINRRQLITTSKGEIEPLYDNASADKLKNNRIEITIKH